MTLSTASISQGLPPDSPAASARQHQIHSMPALYQPAVRTMAACSFAAAAILAAAGAAHAQTAAPSRPATPPATAAASGGGTAAVRQATSTEVNTAFDRADDNHDARLTRAEAERFPEVSRRFEQIDTNHDTFISREEFAKAVTGSP